MPRDLDVLQLVHSPKQAVWVVAAHVRVPFTWVQAPLLSSIHVDERRQHTLYKLCMQHVSSLRLACMDQLRHRSQDLCAVLQKRRPSEHHRATQYIDVPVQSCVFCSWHTRARRADRRGSMLQLVLNPLARHGHNLR